MQNLINELVNSYTQSKYDIEYLQKRINEILEFISPEIASIIRNKKEKEVVKLWNTTKEDGKIKDLFKELSEKMERPIVIYVASKFKNNKYFGVKIIEEALKSEDF